MSTLKSRLESDLHQSMKARDELVTSTLRMAIAAIRTAEVAGKQARELTDEEILGVLTKEAKKRREAATAFADAGRAASAEKELAEEKIISTYLPTPLTDAELETIVTEALTAANITTKAQLGPAMKAAQAAVAGRAEGARISAVVRAHLA